MTGDSGGKFGSIDMDAYHETGSITIDYWTHATIYTYQITPPRHSGDIRTVGILFDNFAPHMLMVWNIEKLDSSLNFAHKSSVFDYTTK
jgi:hypothetical protein